MPALWEELLRARAMLPPPASGPVCERLVVGDLVAAADDVAARRGGGQQVSGAELAAALRRLLEPVLSAVAEHLEARAGAVDADTLEALVAAARSGRPLVRVRGDDAAVELAVRALARRLRAPAARVDLAHIAEQPPGERAAYLERLFDATIRAGAILCLARADILAEPAGAKLAMQLGTELERSGSATVVLATESDGSLPVAIATRVERIVALG
jgi:hypothetical protein